MNVDLEGHLGDTDRRPEDRLALSKEVARYRGLLGEKRRAEKLGIKDKSDSSPSVNTEASSREPSGVATVGVAPNVGIDLELRAAGVQVRHFG